MVSHHYVQVDDVKVFYREAGNPSAPTILLLHGFPTSSFMYRELIPRLADRYHVIAPDLPGFGFTQSPDRAHYAYTFDHLAQTIDHFTETLHLDKYALQVFDYGAPVGWRLAVAHPERVTAIVTQNGNAYVEGLSDGWNPIQKYWKDPSQENRDALREFLKPEAIKWQYTHGVKDPDQVAPEAYTLDAAFVARPGNDEIQLDLFGDYASNVARYPEIPGLLPQVPAAGAGRVGQERSVLPAAGRGSLQARLAEGRGAFLRYRPLRAGNQHRRHRAGDPPLPRSQRAAPLNA